MGENLRKRKIARLKRQLPPGGFGHRAAKRRRLGRGRGAQPEPQAGASDPPGGDRGRPNNVAPRENQEAAPAASTQRNRGPSILPTVVAWDRVTRRRCGRTAGELKHYDNPSGRQTPVWKMRCVESASTLAMGSYSPFHRTVRDNLMNREEVVAWIRSMSKCCEQPARGSTGP